MLALNCVCPATSTLVTLLVHTSRGRSVILQQPGPGLLWLLKFLLSVIAKFKCLHVSIAADVYINIYLPPKRRGEANEPQGEKKS